MFFLTRFFTITDFGDDGSVADGGTKSAVFSWFIWIFLFPLRSIFGFFFQLEFFTRTDFGDGGSVADGRVKFAVLGLFGFFC